MNFKPILILTSLLILLGLFLFYFQSAKSKSKQDERPKIWSVQEEKIHRITVRLPREKKSVVFFKDQDEQWRLNDAGRSLVDPKRWGGIVSLLSGPKSKRMIAPKVTDLKEYGLADPEMIVLLDFRDLDRLQILFGDRTPQGDQIYLKLKDQDPVYIMPSNYCEVIMRLAQEPPLPVHPTKGDGHDQEKG